MALAAATLLGGLLFMQGPAAPWERGLSDPDASARREAAVALSLDAEASDAWLAREASRGSARRQRAILLAAAMRGTPTSLAIVESAMASRGTRRDSRRAYSLLLWGVFGEPGQVPDAALARRAANEYDRVCLAAGMLAQAQDWTTQGIRDRVDPQNEPVLSALLDLVDTLRERQPIPRGETLPAQCAALFGSVLSNGAPVPASWLRLLRDEVPAGWLQAAQTQPAPTLSEWRMHTREGSADGASLALLQLPPEERSGAFESLRSRAPRGADQGWLWGLAGELSLNLPGPSGPDLSLAEAGGVILLAASDAAAGRAAARARLSQARQAFSDDPSSQCGWAGALLMVVAGEPPDLEAIRQTLPKIALKARPAWHRLWLLARNDLEPRAAETSLRSWARGLGAGRAGWVDSEGSRWVALMLAGGTAASEQRQDLPQVSEALYGPRDFPFDDEIYADVADLLLSDLYRWDLQ